MKAELLKAIDDFNPLPACVKCGSEFIVDVEQEPSATCDGCAHDLVAALAREVLKLREALVVCAFSYGKLLGNIGEDDERIEQWRALAAGTVKP